MTTEEKKKKRQSMVYKVKGSTEPHDERCPDLDYSPTMSAII